MGQASSIKEDNATKISVYDKPSRNPDVEVRKLQSGNTHLIVLYSKNLEEFFVIGEDELFIWNMLDGRSSLSAIAKAFVDNRGNISIQDVVDFSQQLVQKGLAEVEGHYAKPRKKRDWFVEIFSFDAERLLSSRFFDILSRIKLGYVAVASIAFSLVVATLLYNELISLILSPATYSFMNSTILGMFMYFYIILMPVFAFHEFSHAIACKICGISPGRFGFGLLYFSTVFFTTADDIMFAPKNHRIFIQIAGVVGNIVTGLGALLISRFFGPGPFSLLNMFIFFSLSICLVNLLPFLRSDGYYVVTDLLDSPNLGPDTWSFLLNLFRARRMDTSDLLTKKNKIVAYSFIGALCAFLIVLLNLTWVHQILFGSDGLFRLIDTSRPVPLTTWVGLGYLASGIGISAFQLWRRFR